MNIALWCFDFIPDNLQRQPWRYTYEFACYLSRYSHSVTVFTNKGVESVSMSFEGFTVEASSSGQITRQLRERGFHLLICAQGILTSLNIGVTRRLRQADLPVLGLMTSPIYSLREVLKVGPREIVLHWRYLWRHALGAIVPAFLIARLVNEINLATVVLSEENRRRLVSKGADPNRVITCPPGRDEQNFQVERGDARYCTSVPPIVLYLGSPLTLRGSDIAMKAIARVIRRQPARLVMLLRLEYPDLAREVNYLERLATQLGITESIELITRQLNQSEVHRWIGRADIVVQPFKIVPSDVPLAILEAMGAGKVVIGTRVDGIPEILGDGRGIVIEPNDVDGLANAILRVIREPQYAENIRMAAKEYSNRMLQSWEQTFSEVLLPLNRIESPTKKMPTSENNHATLRMLSISGVDGVGKTTLMLRIESDLKARGLRVRRVWIRYNHYFSKLVLGVSRLCGLTMLHRRNGTVVHKHHEFQRHPIISFFFQLSKLVDTSLASFFKVYIPLAIDKDCFILCDRYIYDVLIDVAVETGTQINTNSVFQKLFLCLIPKGSKTVVLTAPRSGLLDRRNENVFDPYLNQRIVFYEQLARNQGLPLIEARDIEQTYNDFVRSGTMGDLLKFEFNR